MEEGKKRGASLTAPLLVIAVAVILEAGKRLLAGDNMQGDPYLTVSVFQLVAFLFPCAMYYILKGKKLSTPMLVSPIRVSHILFIAFSFAMFMSGTMLIKFFSYIASGRNPGMGGYYGDLLSGAEGNIAGVILAVIILPAICEEALFRGVLLAEYRSYGSANAILITSLFFAVMHFSFENFVIYLFAGIVLGFVASVTRSTLASIVIHAGANAIAVISDDSYIRLTVLKCGKFFVGFVLAGILMIALILCLSRLENIYYRRAENPPDTVLPPKSLENWMPVFFSPTAMITVVLFIILTIYL